MSGGEGGASGSEHLSAGTGGSLDAGYPSGGGRGVQNDSDAATGVPSDTGVIAPDAGTDAGWEIDDYDDGALIWVKRIGGTSGQFPTDVSALPDGSFLVTGFFYGEAVFAPGEGSETRIQDEEGGGAIFLVRYTSAGELVWVTQAGGEGWDTSRSVQALSDGSSLITGTIEGDAVFGAGEANQTTLPDEDGAREVFIARYSPDGKLEWARQAFGPDEDYSQKVVATADGSAFITGSFKESITFGKGEPGETVLQNEVEYQHRVFIAKYLPDGEFAWAIQPGGTGNSGAGGLCVLSDGSVYSAGSFSQTVVFGPADANRTELTATSGGSADMFIARYHPDGTLAWVRRNRTERNSEAWEVDALADGTSYVTGHIQGVTAFRPGDDTNDVLDAGEGQDVFVARYDPDGSLAWARQGACPSGAEGEGVSAFVDGSVVVTGRFISEIVFGAGEPNETVMTSSDNYAEILVARYNPDGSLAWAKFSTGDYYDYAHAVDVLSNGWSLVVGDFWYTNVFGAGEAHEISFTADESNDGFIAKFAQ
jgi:hypothetical protein